MAVNMATIIVTYTYRPAPTVVDSDTAETVMETAADRSMKRPTTGEEGCRLHYWYLLEHEQM
jgi:hypothetical protein